MELRDYIVVLFLTYCGTVTLISIVTIPTYIPTKSTLGFFFFFLTTSWVLKVTQKKMSSQLSIWVISAETWIFWNKYLCVENIFEVLHGDRISGYSGWFPVNQSEKD